MNRTFSSQHDSLGALFSPSVATTLLTACISQVGVANEHRQDLTGQLPSRGLVGQLQHTGIEDNFTYSNADEFLFSTLVRQWKEERGATSFVSDMIACPSYQRIVGMGPGALQLILNELRQNLDDPDYWFEALEAITGANPISVADYGDTAKMAEAWLLWAETNA